MPWFFDMGVNADNLQGVGKVKELCFGAQPVCNELRVVAGSTPPAWRRPANPAPIPASISQHVCLPV